MLRGVPGVNSIFGHDFDSMTPKSYKSSILTVAAHFKRPLFGSAFSHPIVLRAHKDEEECAAPSQKMYTSFFFGRSVSSMKISKATHEDKSNLSAHSCSEALKSSARNGYLPEGKQLHCHIVKSGYDSEQSIQNQLLNVYVRCRALADACRLFDEMAVGNVVSWNIMISGIVASGANVNTSFNLVFLYFRKMLIEMVEPNHITFTGMLRACIELADVEIGKQFHSLLIKSKYDSNCFVSSALVDLYAKGSLVEEARQVFDRILLRDLVLWNVMVSCYVLNRMVEEAFGVFNLMRLEGVKGDDFTFSSLVSSCGILGACELGRQIHGLIITMSFDYDVLVASALVDMYAKNGNIVDAGKAFDGIVNRNIVSWTTMIVGYGQHGDGKAAMKLFRKMLQEGVIPDELTLASLLSSCANLCATTEVVQLHAYGMKNGFGMHISIANSLLNAYSKCGVIASTFLLFSSTMKPDLITWTSMINAYAFHGLPKEAIGIFEKMLSKGVWPDRIAFLAVLSACSHGGLVDEGFRYFISMTRDYYIVPDSDHYTCLVDLLGRAGHLDEAYNVLASVPYEPGVNALGALMGACKVHGNVELAKWVAEKLFTLEPNEPMNYALMSNIHASVGCWIDVARVRKMMRDACDYKVPGCSWMEISGEVHTFLSSDKSHPKTLEVYSMLTMLFRQIKDEEYASNAYFLFNVVGDACLFNHFGES